MIYIFITYNIYIYIYIYNNITPAYLQIHRILVSPLKYYSKYRYLIVDLVFLKIIRAELWPLGGKKRMLFFFKQR